eukprot:GGOE01054680.1.p1 GENE.GGOE01054680.1~~GGOE01054680.1.p1  ORF type:complete len:362 (-),score=99.36 GGOE01054680.1:166-1251(-)
MRSSESPIFDKSSRTLRPCGSPLPSAALRALTGPVVGGSALEAALPFLSATMVFGHHDSRKGKTCPVLTFPGTTHSEEYITGFGTKQLLYTQSWLPNGQEKPPALILLCHGYGDHTSWVFMERMAEVYLNLGYAVFGIDYVGHGKSGGLHVCIYNWEALCDDVQEHYRQVRQRYPGVKAFFVGESLGGAVALTIANRDPHSVDGMILAAPMCKIAENMIPPPIVVKTLRCVARIFPTLQLVPQEEGILENCIKDKELLARAKANPYWYEARPRLITADQMLTATQNIERFAPKITTPFLIIHGAADRVTAPAASQDFYERAGSSDKQLRMYPDAWHTLLTEPEPTYSRVRQDIKEWLAQRL